MTEHGPNINLKRVTDYGIGETRSITLTVNSEAITKFAELSGDTAACHTDASFARAAGFEGPVLHGAYLVAMISRFVGLELPGPSAVLERMDLSFRNPCYVPCELEVTGVVKQVSEAVSSLSIAVTVSRSDGTMLVTGKTWHKVIRTV